MDARSAGTQMLDDLRSAARGAREALVLRPLMNDCRRLLSERGEANSVAIARSLITRLEGLDDAGLSAFFERLSRDFNPDPAAVLGFAQAYAREPSAQHLIALTYVAEPPRQELLRRINRAPGGTAALVRMRRALLRELPRQPEWQALEADLLHLLSSWFNPGFLEMRRVDWRSPAQLLEQIIRHEAVHQIDGWDDLHRRLQPDRRCFAFFHPQLPDEPLIFVEVALLPAMPGAIAPLIDKKAEPLPAQRWRVAAFYSISNCQPGLRGVSLGNFLIKRVAEELKRELPQLKTFCTLSPIPGFAGWLRKAEPATLPRIAKPAAQRTQEALELLRSRHDLSQPLPADSLQAMPEEELAALRRLVAAFLLHCTPTPQGDPVARFHLDNGARLERIHTLANLSARGRAESCGMMVNYLYDLDRVEANHESFTNGEMSASRPVRSLL